MSWYDIEYVTSFQNSHMIHNLKLSFKNELKKSVHMFFSTGQYSVQLVVLKKAIFQIHNEVYYKI